MADEVILMDDTSFDDNCQQFSLARLETVPVRDTEIVEVAADRVQVRVGSLVIEAGDGGGPTTTNKARVTMDGVPLKRVRSIKLSGEVGHTWKVVIELLP